MQNETGIRPLMLSYEYPPLGGGGAKVVYSLAQEMSAREQALDLVTMRAPAKLSVPALPGVSVEGIPCIRRNPSVCHAHEMLPYLLFALPRLVRLQKKRRFTINHTHFIFPDGVLAYLLKKITGLPYLITAHGSDVPGYNPDRFTFMHKILGPFWRQVADNAAAVICPSRHIEKLVLQASPEVNTCIIANGIDLDLFRHDQKTDGSLLVVTRIFERKGVQYLIKALAGWQDHPPVHVVGDGPYLGQLKQLAESLSVQVNFHGFLDNRGALFRELMEKASFFAFTSVAENFPIVLLEAMVAGKAIVTAHDTGCIEVVGDAALAVDPRDPGAIHDALRHLVEHPEKADQLRRAARQRVAAHFGMQHIVDEHVALYRRYAHKA